MVNVRGETISELEPYITGSLRATLPLYEAVTPAGRNGLALEYLAVAIALMALAAQAAGALAPAFRRYRR
jgi:apolipoprotein N-acyltransferase